MGVLTAPLAVLALLAGGAFAQPPAACLPDAGAESGLTTRYDALIVRHSGRRRLNPRLVKAIIAAESQFTANALSPSGARGLMQLMPATAREMGTEPSSLSDPEANIRAGTDYLAFLFNAARRGGRRSRDLEVRRVIAAYHDGPRALSGRGWPAVTTRYVRTVLSCYRSEAAALRPSGSGPGRRLASTIAEREEAW